MLKRINFSRITSKRFHSSTASYILEPLLNRTLIRVSGTEVTQFLQGLITNDIEHVEKAPSSMYTMFLNSAGRTLYDAIIYNYSEKDSFLIECDKRASETLQRHLKLYRIRRKIDITSLEHELKLFVLFNSKDKSDDVNVSDDKTDFKEHKDLLIYRDPRISDLGSRIISKGGENVEEKLKDIVKIEEKAPKNYRWLRYSLGVGEGVEDLPPGDCFPLESNGDYLHGVSFQKGCYIGQELTARVYHTGVIRKRLMPLFFTKKPSTQPDSKIVQDQVNLGKLRGIEGDSGLALLRTEKALNFKQLNLGDGVAVTCRPKWWPLEAPKEKIKI